MKKGQFQNRIKALQTAKPLVMAPPPDKKPQHTRSTKRKTAYKFGTLIMEDDMKMECVIQDYSAEGAKIKINGMMVMPKELCIAIPELGVLRHAILVWQEEDLVGLQFTDTEIS